MPIDPARVAERRVRSRVLEKGLSGYAEQPDVQLREDAGDRGIVFEKEVGAGPRYRN